MSQSGANSNGGSGADPVETLTGNSGGAVSPDGSFNIDVLGNNSTGIEIVGTPASSLLTVMGLASSTTQVGTVELATAIETGTLTDATRAVSPDSLGPILVSEFVVAPGGVYTTIQSALDAANAAGGGTVFIRDGTYIEDLTLYDSVHIIGMSESATIIDGTHTPPSTGVVNIFRCTFQDATAIFSSAAAGTATLLIEDCTFTVTNGFTFDLANWTGAIAVFDIGIGGTNDGTINNTAGATIFAIAASLGVGSGQTMITSGTVYMQEVDLDCPWDAQTGSDIECDYVTFTQSITLSNDSTGIFDFCRHTTGASAAITMSSSAAVTITNCVIDSSNTPAIAGAGAGTLSLENVTYLNDTTVAGTLTLAHSSLTEEGTVYAQTVNVGARSPGNPYNIAIEASTAGLIGQSIQNTSNNAAAGANLQMIVETGAADAFTYYGVNSTTDWATGIDNSDSDSFKMAAGTTPSGTNVWTMTTAGERTMPLQPAFEAILGTSDTNATGDGTLFVIGTGNALTEIFDQNGDFVTTGTFTAPVSGRYFFYFGYQLGNIAAGHTEGSARITTSNYDYNINAYNPAATMNTTGPCALGVSSIMADMDALDNTVFSVVVAGSTKTITITGTSTRERTFVGGFLIC